MHKYQGPELQRCLAGRTLRFAGDSTVRQLFWTVVERIDEEKARQSRADVPKHGDVDWKGQNCTLSFTWDPYLNKTRGWAWMSADTLAVVLGGGLWHARHHGHYHAQDFGTELRSTLASLGALDVSLGDARDHDHVGIDTKLHTPILFMPAVPPNALKLDAVRAAALNDSRIAAIHVELQDINRSSAMEVQWSNRLMIDGNQIVHYTDGIHGDPIITAAQVDIILNRICYTGTATDRAKVRSSCCVGPPIPTRVQQLLLVLSSGVVSYWLCTFLWSRRASTTTASSRGSLHIWKCAAILATAVVYCYVADRTSILQHTSKVIDENVFVITAIICIGLLLVTMRSMPSNVQVKGAETFVWFEEPFLHRLQTEEWKGWMQALILFYHYFGMSRVLWVYRIVRVLVASYLFMTGYGHTIYFLKTKDYSLYRVASVLVRLNLLACMLAYSMNNNYEFYYFPALSSFWFLVVYISLLKVDLSKLSFKEALFRVLLSLGIIKTILRSEKFFGAVLAAVGRFLGISLNQGETHFRIALDVYTVYIGMLAAIIYLKATNSPRSRTERPCYMFRHRSAMRMVCLSSSIMGLTGYALVSLSLKEKRLYNRWHPVLSPIAILAFVTLRNATPTLRNHYSPVFAWLGRCSLEAFVLQYHIWLAADTKGLLRLGLFNARAISGSSTISNWNLWLESVLITCYFIWTSWAVAHATQGFSQWIVGKQSGLDTSVICSLTGGHEQGGNSNHLFRWLTRDGGLRARLTMVVITLVILRNL